MADSVDFINRTTGLPFGFANAKLKPSSGGFEDSTKGVLEGGFVEDKTVPVWVAGDDS